MARPQKPKIFQIDTEISTTERKVGAYTIEHLPSGCVYHGSTVHLYRRVIEHQKDLRSGNHGNQGLQELYTSGGELELRFFPTATDTEALLKEQSLIDQTPKDKLLNRSFNAANTMAGLWENPEVRAAFSESRKGNNNASGAKHTEEWKVKKAAEMKGNQHLLGHKHSDETRKKLSARKAGVPLSETHKAASAEGRTKERVVIDGETYQNAAAAGRAIGMTYEGVKKRCRSDKFPNWKLVPK